MRKRWEPAGSAAGSHLASEVGGRPPGIQEPDRVLARYAGAAAARPGTRRPAAHSRRATPTRHPRLTLWYGWCGSDGSPFSSAPSARARCSRSRSHSRTRTQAGAQARSRSLSRLLASTRVRPCVRLRVRIHSCVCSRVRVRPGRTPGSDQGRHPRQQRSLGSERGLATPSPDGKGEIPLGPSVKIMPVDSYSTLGRSCEPAFKWIRQARPQSRPQSRGQPRARAARRCQALAGGWSALGGHEASCSFT